MKTTKLLFSLCLAMLAPHAFATGEAEQASKGNADITAESASETVKTEKKKSRFYSSISFALLSYFLQKYALLSP